jgi:hypothetical protein
MPAQDEAVFQGVQMGLRNGLLAFMAAMMVPVCASAQRDEISELPIYSLPSRKPECKDPPPLDPVVNVESLPTHQRITTYLMDERTRPRFSCTSATLVYVGTRDTEGIRVVSKYRAGGRVHAETYAGGAGSVGNRRHGVVRIQRRDGSTQALEYYCRGFEVGFHRYFDAKGELVAVADYSRSDYEWRKANPTFTYREFHRDSSRLGTVSTALASYHRFREVFRVRNGSAERVSLSIAGSFDSNWEALDPTSTVRDWTEPGMQGTVTLHKQPWQIRNFDFQYQSFAEVYQRKRLGISGVRAPTEYNSSLLECPWIDEAMEPGLKDPRFKFESPEVLTESERAASPEQRLASCFRAPTTACLLELALVSARLSQPLQGDTMRNYADDALAAGQPALARTAMEVVLADTRSYTFPTPFFARQGAIKAQAEVALGLRAEAMKTADAAFANAMGRSTHAAGRDVGALEAIGPRLARVGAIDKAREAFREVPVFYAENSPVTLEEIALALAREGNISGARETLAELMQLGAQPGALEEPDVLLEVAAAQAKRGDVSAAAATLDRMVIPARYDPAQVESLNAKVAAVRARFPPSEALDASIESALEQAAFTPRLAVVKAYCESGNPARGVKVLERARNALRRPNAEQIADLGAAEATCGRADRARADFAQARKVIRSLSASGVGSDTIVIPSPAQGALSHLRLRMVDAGILDDLPNSDWEPEEFTIAFAAKKAELGDPASALSTLDALRIEAPVREDQQLRQMLTRARVLRLLSRNEEAEAEFARARRMVLAQDAADMRAALLMRLAEARLRDQQPVRARSALDEAQAALLAHLASPGTEWYRNGPSMTALAGAWAATGNDAAAIGLVSQGLKQMKFHAIALRAADRVNGEIAIAQARTGAASESMASLRRVEGMTWRAWYLSQVMAIAQQRGDQALQGAVSSLWAAALDEAQRTIESATDAGERRRVYHAYLATLRRSSPPGTSEQRQQALESLRRNLDLFTDVGERARAGCELAFTYQQLGSSAPAATEFASVRKLPPRPRGREAGTPPLPVGACAYWMSSTPMSVQASSELARTFEAQRATLQPNNGMTAPERALQELALIASESEAGEIDWATGTRLAR